MAITSGSPTLNSAAGERGAWSAGLAVAIPNTPHTHLAPRHQYQYRDAPGQPRAAAQQVRYGFEFTIPITLARYFGHRPRPAPAVPAAPGASAPVAPGLMPDRPTDRSADEDRNAGAPVHHGCAGDRGRHHHRMEERRSPAAHVTADDTSFDSGLIENGQVWRYTFTRPGTYAFHCTPHPFMKGTVVVKSGSQP